MEKEDLKILQHQVTTLRAEGKYKETIEAGYNLLKWGIELNDYKSILTAHINIAASYYCIGDIEEAFNSIAAYEEICLQHGDEADQVNLYNILFLLYEYNKNFSKAKKTLEKSISLGEKIKKYNIVSNGYSNYSHICMEEDNNILALKMAEKGLEMAKLHEPKSPILELRVKLNIAKACIGIEDFHTSKALIDEMIHDSLLDSFIREKSQCHHLLGIWYSKQKLYCEAYESLTSAKKLVESYGDVYLLKIIQEERLQLCDLMNDISLGYITQKEYIDLLKEINSRELALTALKLDVKHNLSTIEKKANTDYLTGLYNRNFIETKTDEWLEQAQEKKENIVCIVFDIDDFKLINDQHGHLFGDEVIKQVSKACSDIFSENALFGRFGGDEFVAILKNESLESGKRKAELIREKLNSYLIEMNGKSIAITASIGVSDNSAGAVTSFSELFNQADKGLYKVKQNGKNSIYVSY